MNVGSLFSGIGGFDLGLERAGMRVVWQCEQDDYCRRVLARHWPGVPCHPDVRALVADASGAAFGEVTRDMAASARVSEGGRSLNDGVASSGSVGGEGGALPVPVPYVDVLCGGFPCQDLSLAGKGAGIDGARSGLWSEYARLVGELRPRYVIVENVAALLARGMGRVLGDLAALGYDAEWDCLPASAFGAPHRRDRVWLVAYPGSDDGGSGRPRGLAPTGARKSVANGSLQDVAYPARVPEGRAGAQPRAERQRAGAGGERGRAHVADTDGQRLEGSELFRQRHGEHQEFGNPPCEGIGWWQSEPDVGRVTNGAPARVDRLRSLGNALVPQIAEWIGRRIVSFEASTSTDRRA